VLHLNRRRFLTESSFAAAIAAGTWSAATPTAASSPNDQIQVVIVGVNGRGRQLAEGFASLDGAHVAAIADVDQRVLPPIVNLVTEKQGSKPRTISDFRTLLDDPGFDAFVFAVPDHWHALATILACQAGKDVYVEKPASHNIREGTAMVAAARKYGRVVQHGTQSRSRAHIRSAVQAMREGLIGDVLMAKAINNQLREPIGRTADEPSPPPDVDYDLWLGPAPKRPFNPNRFHYNWHWIWDYGTGDIGNDGVHQIDIARWALGVEDPVAITSAGGQYFYNDDHQTPDTQIVTWEFPNTTLVYEMRLWARYVVGRSRQSTCCEFYGTKGFVRLDYYGWEAFGLQNKPLRSERPSDELDPPHLQNFVDCVRAGKPDGLNAEIREGHLSSRLAHMGNIAQRVKRRLAFDAGTESFIDDVEANALLSREHREGFDIPEFAS